MNSSQYNNLNTLLAQYSELNAAFEQAEAEIKIVQLAAARELLPKHAELKVRLTDLEAALRKIADQFYTELFAADEKRTHQTPFGGLKYHKSSALDFDDAEKVLLKIKLRCAHESEAARAEGRLPRFNLSQLIRTHEEPNLLAMDAMDDATLALFGVKRETKENFKVVPFTMKSDKPARKKNSKEAA